MGEALPPYVECPCGGHYVHMISVVVDQNGSLGIVDHAGCRNEIVPPRTLRGSTVTVRCWCEEGHGFEIEFYFRKGELLLSVTDPEECGEPGSTLWRD